ncbi:MAG: hypothetical protein IPG71_02425 [bacterium]|nr:hypothetical protein [bacterium]
MPSQYNDIAAAYSAANSGDTILIGAGQFSVSLTTTKRLAFIGAGFDLTLLNGYFILNAGSNGAVFESLSINLVNNSFFLVNINSASVDSVHVKRCKMVDTIGGIPFVGRNFQAANGFLSVSDCVLMGAPWAPSGWEMFSTIGEDVLFGNCVFAYTTSDANRGPVISGNPSSLIMRQCTVLGAYRIFGLTNSPPMQVVNCIFHDWVAGGSWGNYPAGATIDYCASTGSVPPIGSNFIQLANDPFVNYNETANYQFGVSDLRLNTDPQGGALCTDAGDPNVLDLDGTRSDLGIYGGQTPYLDTGAPNYPFVQSLTVPSSVTVGNQLQIQSQGRIGRGY